ncbi:hypothetical protein ACFWCA_46465 [Streptomyces phaeochromogenes]|uniref:hypothetical protein n=1 Tax=Streptomyces phaeochromogenes TaxID=1923 RepID=UPI0036A9C8DB
MLSIWVALARVDGVGLDPGEVVPLDLADFTAADQVGDDERSGTVFSCGDQGFDTS